ncbi:MAG: Rrf2 family transcriptional regulator [Coriobacteriales bacterium]|jgi:Rrf2 family protein|nr:Rrf2 family transcriptional regulator [Coriobacteriales bacterium]
MKITKRTDYAIRLIADLAKQPDCCLGLRSLSDRHGVTYAFARTVQQGLLKAGIIRACRGINGGIGLARPLDQITVLEVFEAAQGTLDDTFDIEDTSWYGLDDDCLSDQVWASAKQVMSKHFSSITMQDLMEKRIKSAS